MLLREFIQKYPNGSFDMMTPGGYVFLTPEQAQGLLAGKPVMGNPGDLESAMPIDAEELLAEPVLSARWENHVCHMFMDYPMKEEPEEDEKEVIGVQEHDKERKLKERLKANYEAYIQQLKQKPAPELIEMASEIATIEFIYKELSMEGAIWDCADYLLQFENPLQIICDRWKEQGEYNTINDMQNDLISMIYSISEEMGVSECRQAENESSFMNQGVTMC